jgi:hypothetical protein
MVYGGSGDVFYALDASSFALAPPPSTSTPLSPPLSTLIAIVVVVVVVILVVMLFGNRWRETKRAKSPPRA